MMQKDSKILVLGGRGMLGSAVLRQLDGFTNILKPTSKDLDLVNQVSVAEYFAKHKPEYVFFCAAKVGGIYANMTYKADFIYQNLMMECNVMHNCHLNGVKKVVFVSSGCVYPRDTQNPILESAILTGKLEPSNEHYAMAKIAGIKMCESYFDQYGLKYAVIIPNNIFGEGDNYHPENSHVMAALIRKFHEAKVQNKPTVEVWGSGKQMREFIYVSDVASGCIAAMVSDEVGSFNCGGGMNISIGELSHLVKKVIGFEGEIVFDTSKPEGHFQKYFSSEKLKSIGWDVTIPLERGIQMAYDWYTKSLS